MLAGSISLRPVDYRIAVYVDGVPEGEFPQLSRERLGDLLTKEATGQMVTWEVLYPSSDLTAPTMDGLPNSVVLAQGANVVGLMLFNYLPIFSVAAIASALAQEGYDWSENKARQNVMKFNIKLAGAAADALRELL